MTPDASTGYRVSDVHRGSLPVVWLAGAPCSGKSTAAWELYAAGYRPGMRVAYVDIDQLGMVSPAPAGDPECNQVKGRAVGRVLRNFAAAGAELAIVSGVVEPRDVPAYRRACRGCELSFVRLTVDRACLVDRLTTRYGDEDVAAALALEARLDEADLDAVTVDTTGLSPAEVAQRVRAVRLPTQDSGWRGGGGRDGGPAAFHSAGVCVWVHGAPAIGKSAVGWALFRQLIDRGGAGYLDLEQLSFLTGASAAGAAQHGVRAANAAAVWDVFAQAGARWLVLSGAMLSGSELSAYRRLLPHVDFRPVRLTASDQDIRARVLRRGLGTGPHLAGDPLVGQPPAALEAAARFAQKTARRLAASGLPGVEVDTTGVSVEASAALVRQAVGLD